MRGLQRFENRLEQAISGVFARAFRSAVQPVEIAAALQREADNNAQILSRDRRLAPNDFHVELSQADLERLAPYDSAMAGELADAARGARRAAVLRLPGPGHHLLRDRRRPDDRPVPGAQPGDGQRAGQRPARTRYAGPGRCWRSTAPATRCSPPALVVGRGTEADIRINDPGVSRRHVEFTVSVGTVEEGSPLHLEVRDLGSTNGMLVDGHRATKVALRDGSPRAHRQHRHAVRVVEDADRGATMSELTLFLIRLAYLAILWIFVLSAISVIRSDMFGARVPESARGGAARAAPEQAGAEPKPPPRGHPPTCWSSRASTQGDRAELDEAPLLIGRGPRRGDPARRRLRLHPARPDRRRPSDQWFVEDLGSTNGTYVGTRPDHPAHHDRARHPGPDRQDDPRAAEVAADDRPAPAVLRDLRRRAGPQGQPGLRVRRPLAARGLRRRRRRRPRRHRLQHRDRPAAASSTSSPPDDDLLDQVAGALHRAARPDRRAGRGGPRRSTAPAPPPPSRSSTAPASAIGHVGDSRAYLFRGGEITPAHQRPHVRADPHRRGPDHRGRAADPPAPQPHPQGPRRHPRDRARPVPRRPGAGRPALLVQRRRQRRRSTDDRIADILGTGTPDYAAVELVRASLEAGSTDNVTCVVADVGRRGHARPTTPCEPLLVGAAAELPRRRSAATGRPASSAATAAATPASSSRSRADVPDDARRHRDRPDRPRGARATHPGRRPRFAWLRRHPRRWPWCSALRLDGRRRGLVVEPAAVLRRPSRTARSTIFRGIDADAPRATSSRSRSRAPTLDRRASSAAVDADAGHRGHGLRQPRRRGPRVPSSNLVRAAWPCPGVGCGDGMSVATSQPATLMGFVHRRRRGAELFLLLLALAVGIGAYAAVGLGVEGEIPADIVGVRRLAGRADRRRATSWSGSSRRTPTRCCCRSWPRSTGSAWR